MGNCVICGKDSELCCSDCEIEQRGSVYKELRREMTMHIPKDHPVLVSVRAFEQSLCSLTSGTPGIDAETRFP